MSERWVKFSFVRRRHESDEHEPYLRSLFLLLFLFFDPLNTGKSLLVRVIIIIIDIIAVWSGFKIWSFMSSLSPESWVSEDNRVNMRKKRERMKKELCDCNPFTHSDSFASLIERETSSPTVQGDLIFILKRTRERESCLLFQSVYQEGREERRKKRRRDDDNDGWKRRERNREVWELVQMTKNCERVTIESCFWEWQ